MSDPNQTPVQEAVSLITILAILAALGCYAGAVQDAPGLAPSVFWVASLANTWLPALSVLGGAQAPILVGSAIIGATVFVCGIPFAGLLAAWLAKAQLQNVEQHTLRLKRNRASLQRKTRSHDDFIAR
jgi:hypothetical protein